MAVLIVQGGPPAFRGVFLLMIVATLVDATDGALARAVRVKEVLPHFDGRQLDYLIDFLTYVALPDPAAVACRDLAGAARVPGSWCRCWPGPIGSARSKPRLPTDTSCGFPAYWNIVAFYLYVIHFHVAPLARLADHRRAAAV